MIYIDDKDKGDVETGSNVDKMTTSFVDFNGKLQLAMGEDIIETDEE